MIQTSSLVNPSASRLKQRMEGKSLPDYPETGERPRVIEANSKITPDSAVDRQYADSWVREDPW